MCYHMDSQLDPAIFSLKAFSPMRLTTDMQNDVWILCRAIRHKLPDNKCIPVSLHSHNIPKSFTFPFFHHLFPLPPHPLRLLKLEETLKYGSNTLKWSFYVNVFPHIHTALRRFFLLWNWIFVCQKWILKGHTPFCLPCLGSVAGKSSGL